MNIFSSINVFVSILCQVWCQCLDSKYKCYVMHTACCNVKAISMDQGLKKTPIRYRNWNKLTKPLSRLKQNKTKQNSIPSLYVKSYHIAICWDSNTNVGIIVSAICMSAFWSCIFYSVHVFPVIESYNVPSNPNINMQGHNC